MASFNFVSLSQCLESAVHDHENVQIIRDSEQFFLYLLFFYVRVDWRVLSVIKYRSDFFLVTWYKGENVTLKAVMAHLFDLLIFFDILLHSGCRLAHRSKCDTELLLVKRCNKAKFGSSLCQRGFNVRDLVIQRGWIVEEGLKRLAFKVL